MFKKIDIRKIFLSKLFILFILIGSLFFYASAYVGVDNAVTDLIETILAPDFIVDFEPAEIDVALNMIAIINQPSVILIGLLFLVSSTLFLNSFIFWLLLKIDQRELEKKHRTTYSKVLNILYITFYITATHYFISTLYIIWCGDLMTNNLLFSVILNLVATLLETCYFIFRVRSEHYKLNVVTAAVGIYVVYLIIGLVHSIVIS